MPFRFVEPLLSYIEDRLFATMRRNLQQHLRSQWGSNQDTLFAPHTGYVAFACQHGIPLRAVALWERLEPEVEAAQTKLGTPIHQGAPLYNTGLCYFVSGSFERAAQYLAAAAEADEQAGRGCSPLAVGGGLAESLLIDPLEDWMKNTVAPDYQKGTGTALSKQEIKGLVSFLDARRSDAVVFLAALHRLKSQMEPPDNSAAGVQRARSLADLLVVLESSLKHWQTLPSTTTLYPRAKQLTTGSSLQKPFQDAEDRYAGQDWGLTTTVNTMLTDEDTGFVAATTTPEAAARALYASCRLRNALLHVLDDSLAVYQGTNELTKAAAFALVSIKLSSLAQAGQLSTL